MDYTKDHKNRVNSLLMEKWGYGKKDKAVEESEESDEGSKQGYQGPGELQQIFNPSGEGEGNTEDIELDEMQGHPGKCCDDAHPDEDHEGYMGRIAIRLAEDDAAE